MIKIFRKPMKVWWFGLAGIVLANASYFNKDFIGWCITLGFFFLAPGYLLLRIITQEIRDRWEIISFSLGLSILILMIGGLLLNSLHNIGLERPLTTWNIFITLDAITAVLLALSSGKTFSLPRQLPRFTTEQIVVFLALTLLPLLAIGGAFRLNNGASNFLTMILFLVIPILFLLLIFRKNLRPLYPYAVFVFGLAVLLSTSLRGWYITGHDIQHEFLVFQIASRNNYWNVKAPAGDPYNACLSITLLPTLVAKITTIGAPYIYKAVFQTLFALGLIPIYLFIKRLSSSTKALTGALIFISFPTFLNDMPFLNRQEMAFVFFGMLALLTFVKVARRTKTILTILLLLGIILSHYSSGYVSLAIMSFAALFYKLLTYRSKNWKPFFIPAMRLSIIGVAFLFTFLWNTQVTSSSGGLANTVIETVQGLWGHPSSQANGVSYSLLSPPTLSPSSVLLKDAGRYSGLVYYAPPLNMPPTKLGNVVSHLINVATLNSLLRSLAAKILQVLLIVGLGLFYFTHRKKASQKETYLYALGLGCLVLLVMITVLPQLSIDYGVTRLFQQTLVMTALFIITAAEFLLKFLGKYRVYIVASSFAFLFLDLSGFVPQLLGGYPPQLALNNSGTYYDIYYVHGGELIAAKWLGSVDKGQSVAVDQYAQVRLEYTAIDGAEIRPLIANKGFLYEDYANAKNGLYAGYLSGDVIEYNFNSPTATNGNLLYANQDSKIYHD